MRNAIYILALTILSASPVMAQNLTLYIGTYTVPGKGEGIYTANVNTTTGKATLLSVTKDVANPSFITLSPSGQYLYSVNENGKESMASAFKVNQQSGALQFLNKQPTDGDDPCYILSDAANVFTANYSSGSITVFNRHTDGSLGTVKQLIKHNGHGADPRRQAAPHAHQVIFSPDKQYIFSNDLGTDHLYIYRYNASAAKPLLLTDSIFIASGAGPRHLTFSKDGRMMYLIGEIDGNIYVYSLNNNRPIFLQKITAIRTGSTPKHFDSADLHVSPDGKFLYASLRADINTISVFEVAKDGKLRFSNQFSTLGKGPRSFIISPDGSWLLAANQYTNNVVIFRVNKHTGALIDSGNRIEVGAPVSLIFGK